MSDDLEPYRPLVPEVDSDFVGRYARFLPVATAFAGLSKDPSTKVGAVILGRSRETLSGGWNGAPRGSCADEDGRFQDRPTKLRWAVHAEANAIAGAARAGISLEDSTIVVTHMPCIECAKLIIQSGIATVIAPEPEGRFAENWAEQLAVARAMFTECGVRVFELPSDISGD